MSDILQRIVAVKREEVAALLARHSLRSLRADAESRHDDRRDFEGAMRRTIAAGRSADCHHYPFPDGPVAMIFGRLSRRIEAGRDVGFGQCRAGRQT